MIRAERTEYSNGILKTRVSPILTHCNSYSQIPQERPKNFPKSCFWDVFVTLWALFLTGGEISPDLYRFVQCDIKKCAFDSLKLEQNP